MDVLRARLLQGAVVAAALAYSLQFMSFLDAKVAVLAVGLVLAACCMAWRRRFTWRGLRLFWPLWAVWGFQLAIHAGLGQSAVPADTGVALARMALVLLVGAAAADLLHVERWRRGLLDAVAVSTLLVAALALLQYTGVVPALFPVFPGYAQPMYSVFGNQDLLGGYVALGLALTLVRAVRGQWPPAATGAALAVLVPALVLSGSRSAWLASVCGGAVALGPMVARSRVRAAGLAGAVILVALAAALFAPAQTFGRVTGTFSRDDVGGRVRLWVWEGGVRMAVGAPWVGRGVGSFGYWSPSYLGDAQHAAPGRHYYNERHAVHAHSDPLEWFAATGLAGVFLLGVFAVRLARCRGEEWAGLTTLLVFCCLNATFVSPPHAVAAVLLAGGLLARQQGTGDPMASRTAAIAIPAATLAVSGLLVFAAVVPSWLLRTAEAAHLRGAASTLADYERAVRYPWPIPSAHRSYGIALAEQERYSEACEQLLRAKDGVSTGEVPLALAVVAQRLGKTEEAARWAEECLRIWPRNAAAWAIRLETAPNRAECLRLRDQARLWLSPVDLEALPACGPDDGPSG